MSSVSLFDGVEMRCEKCGGEMRKKTVSSGNASGIVVALIVFALGCYLSAIGAWIIGAPIILCSLFMGGKRTRVWRCTRCGFFFNRS